MGTNTTERIRARAQEIYDYNQEHKRWLIFDGFVIRGRTALDDWLEAEREILAKHKEE